MATYYIDPEGGNNSNDGTSFANRKKWVTGLTIAAGDNIRLIGSPDPTVLGTGLKIQKTAQGSNNGATIGTITYSTTTGDTSCYFSGGSDSGGVVRGHNLTTGDTIQIHNNTDSNGNINGTWEVTVVDANNFKIDGFTATSSGSGSGGKFVNSSGKRIKLNSAVTQTIASTGPRTSTWVASTDVTCTLEKGNTSTMARTGEVAEHDCSDKIAIGANFGTGKAAYYQLPSALNLSNYEQISLMFNAGLGSWPNSCGVEAGSYSLRLCTDTAGNTSVHTIDLIDRGQGSTSDWIPTVKDFGSALNSSIQSVALYVDRDDGAREALLSNIIACKASSSADSITHRSLIGLDTTADPDWYPIKSISGTRLMLDAGASGQKSDLGSFYYIGQTCAWSASNNSVTVKKRETIRMPIEDLTSTNDQNAWLTFTANGSQSSRITITGGWDRTSMSSQSLELSWFDGLGSVQGLCKMGAWSMSYYDWDKIGAVRFAYAWYSQGGHYYSHIKDMHICGCGNTSWSSGALYIYGGYWCPLQLYGNSNRMRFEFTGNLNLHISTTSSPGNGYQEQRSDHVWRNVCSGDSNNQKGIFHFLDVSSTNNRDIMVQEVNVSHSALYNYYGFRWENNRPLDILTFNAGRGQASQYSALYLKDGTHTITTVNCDHQNVGQVAGGKTTFGTINNDENTFYQPGTYPGERGEILSCTGGELHLLGTNASTIGGRLVVSNAAKAYINNTTFDYHYGSITSSDSGYVYMKNSGGYTYYSNILGKAITADTSTRHTASGYSWKMYGPASFEVARIPVKASSLVTVSVWIHPSQSSMTDLGLKVEGQSIGIADTQGVSSSLSSSGWAKQSLTFTPANAGIAKISLTSGHYSYAFFDDMEVSQA